MGRFQVFAAVALASGHAQAFSPTGSGSLNGSVSATGYWNGTSTSIGSSTALSTRSSSSVPSSSTVSTSTSSNLVLSTNSTSNAVSSTSPALSSPSRSASYSYNSSTTSTTVGTGVFSTSSSTTSSSVVTIISLNSSSVIGTGSASSSSSLSTKPRDTSSNAFNTTSPGLPFGTGSTSSSLSTSAIVANNITLLPGQPVTSDGTTYLYTSSSEYVNGSPSPLPTTSASVTSTMTTVPSGVSTEIFTDASLTVNGWVTTTGSDSSSTIVPVIVPCPGCAPIIVWNFPKITGVDFTWPTFPKLPTFNLPCIQIFGITVAGDCPTPPETDRPAPDPEKPSTTPSSTPSSTTGSSTGSSSSLESCTVTQTASDCRVYCKPIITSIASFNSTTQSCSTTCPTTITGCSVTGYTTTTTATTNTTTSSATVSALACPLNTDADTSDIAARGIRPVGNAYLQRREGANYAPASTVMSLGAAGSGCVLAAMTPAATPVTRPSYPQGAAMYTYDSEGKLTGTSDVARYVTVTSCPLAMKTNSFSDQTNAQNANLNFFTTTDHAYEIHWLEDFFSFLLDSTGTKADTLKCDAFQQYFFAKDNSGSMNRLTGVWNSLPSDDWMEGFVLMTKYMNTYAKGTIANVPKMQQTVNNLLAGKKNIIGAKTQLSQAITILGKKTDILKKMNIGCMTMNYEPVMDAITGAWQRIYYSLQVVDAVVSCDLKVQNPLSVADRFVAYSEEIFNDKDVGMDPQSRTLGQQLIDAIDSDITTIKAMPKYSSISADDASKLAEQEAILAMVKATGSPFDSSNRNWGVSFDPSGLAASVSKRSLGKRQACSLPQSSLASDGASSTAGSASTTLAPGQSSLPNNSTVSAPTPSTSSLNSTTSVSVPTSATTSGNTTTVASTTAPPITSCALATASATTLSDLTLSPTPYCSCNDDWQAAVQTTVGDDGATTYTCALGTTTTLAVSTDIPVTPTSATPTPTSTTPTTTAPTETPTESCHTQYKLVLDTFDIYGADWDDSKLDAGGDPGSGQGLHDQVSGCAAVTKWNFETMTPTDDSPWEFHASGQITIWQKNCIEHAIVSAGAPDGSCSGSG